ncbi:MAG: hypothetical protein PVF58_14175 [Candidatus Methanofastidiosia archaeon]
MRNTQGELERYVPLKWQKDYHADCMLCHLDDKANIKDRITWKSRKIGWTNIECMDELSCALFFERTDFPISSITKRTGTTPIKMIKDLCDTATPQIPRNMRVERIIRLENGSRIFQVPGGNPDAIRSYNTPKCVNDELGRTPYNLAPDMFQASRGTMSGFFVQHDIGSTMPEEPDHEFNLICLNAEELGFILYNLSMFPTRFYDADRNMMDQIDQEYLDAYPDDIETMRRLCDEAWKSGLWLAQTAIDENEKYWGLWPEDRGLIPLCWWWNLDKRENHFKHDKLGAEREYMCSLSAGTGSFLTEQVVNSIATVPLKFKEANLWAYEKQGDNRHMYDIGWDFASKKHKACVSIFKRLNDSKMQVYVELMEKLDIRQQKLRLIRLMRDFPTIVGIGIDATGPGVGFAQEVEDMRNRGMLDCGIWLANMSTKVTEEYINGEEISWRMNWSTAWNFKMLAEAIPPRVRILDNVDIKRDFLIPREKTLKAGVDAVTGSHADIAWSSFIACKVEQMLTSELPSYFGQREVRPDDYIDPRKKAMIYMYGRPHINTP